MTTDRTGFAAMGRNGSWAAGLALLAFMPLFNGCVSAVDDTSAFGFAGAGANAGASVSGDAGSATGEGATNVAAADASASTKQASGRTAEGGTGSGPAPTIGRDRTSANRNLADGSIAAFAGGNVSQGDASPGSGKETSLFTSLFARSEARTPVANGERGKSRRILLKRDGPPEDAGGSALPGVDPSSLFEIGQRASADEDMVEDLTSGGSYQVASLSGLARLAPNGLKVQREDVETACFPRELVGLLHQIENRFGQKVIVTSGYRSPAHNRAVNGARLSQHMGCKAADIIVPSADRFAVAEYVRSLPGRGGVGTYCNTMAIHVDVGPRRDWNWRCRNRSAAAPSADGD